MIPSWLQKSYYHASLLALSLLKIWLITGQVRPAFAYAIHDDSLFITLADSLARGDWLGPFNQLTLIKGPVYPLWLALCHHLSVPSYLMQHLLHIGACLLFVTVIGLWAPQHWLRLPLYAVMLFNPGSTAFMVVHFKRESIYGSLSLLVFAGLIGLYGTRSYEKGRLLRWALLAGAALTAFWLTREEGLWIVPPALVLAAYAGVQLLRRRPESRVWVLSIFFLPIATWAAAQLAVAGINYSRYGIFATNELKSKSFRAAYGALTRVEHERWQPFNPVPRETRQRIYAVSPAFAELEPYLEGDLGRRWGKHGRRLLRGPDRKGEIGGGWFLWGFRAAIEAAGYYRSGPDTLDYYSRLATEVHRACDEGKLPAGRRRDTLTPPLRREYLESFFGVLPRAIPILTRWKGSEPLSAELSRGEARQVALFRSISGDRVAPRKGEPHQPPTRLDRAKMRILDSIWWVYNRCGGVLAALALIAWSGALILTLRGPPRALLAVNTALLAGIVAQVAVVSLVHVMSFPSINAKYLSPAILLVPPFIVLSLVDFGLLLRARIRPRPEH